MSYLRVGETREVVGSSIILFPFRRTVRQSRVGSRNRPVLGRKKQSKLRCLDIFKISFSLDSIDFTDMS